MCPGFSPCVVCFFFFNDTATTEIYTLSLHDALPICPQRDAGVGARRPGGDRPESMRSEEHTSELQSRFGISYAVFCLKKKQNIHPIDAIALPDPLRRHVGLHGMP